MELSSCIICEENNACVAIVPCGHVYSCDKCIKKCIQTVDYCSICRKRISSYLRIYLSVGLKEKKETSSMELLEELKWEIIREEIERSNSIKLLSDEINDLQEKFGSLSQLIDKNMQQELELDQRNFKNFHFCPNTSNIYHTCSDYCYNRYSS